MDSVRFVITSFVLCAIWDPRRTKATFVKQAMLDGVDLNILRNHLGKNTVVSSFAFRLPLCKLAAAALGATRHEIISILDIHTLSETKSCYSSLFPAVEPLFESDLTMLNKIYVNYTDAIDDGFINGSQAYGVTVSKIGFDFPKDAIAYVNREFSSKTFMRLRDILELGDINEKSSIILVNGFHYKGSWETPFTRTSTQVKQFKSGQKTLKIEMMKKMMQCLFMNDATAKFKAISLRLSQPGVYMTLVLPYRNSTIISLLEMMSHNPQFIDKVNKKSEWKFVNVGIPRFKIKSCLDWMPYLKEIGLNLTTNMENNGLLGILNDENYANMYVSKAKQKVFVEIDEGPMKNKYGAVEETPFVVSELEQPEAPPGQMEDFTVNGPFYFTITLTIRQKRRGRQVNKMFQVLNGIYYGPE